MAELCPNSCACFCHSIAFNGVNAPPEQIALRCISCGRKPANHRPTNFLAWWCWLLGRGPKPAYFKLRYSAAGRWAD